MVLVHVMNVKMVIIRTVKEQDVSSVMNHADNAMEQVQFANVVQQTTYKMPMEHVFVAVKTVNHALDQQQHAHLATMVTSYLEPIV